METVQANELPSQGAPVEVGANQPFFIHGSQRMWIVQAGCLDLFLVKTRDGEPVGARQHFLRAEAGKAILGLSPNPEQNVGILAIVGPGTSLYTEIIEDLRDAIEKHPQMIPLLDTWIEQLGASIATKIIPKKVVPLHAKKEVTVSDEAKAVSPSEGVIWVQHRAGESRFLADPNRPPIKSESIPFPVTRFAWLEAQPKSRLYAFNSGDLTVVDGCWEGLQSFHANVIASLILNQRAADEKEVARLQVQAQEDNSRVDFAFVRLASSLSGAVSSGVTESASSDPLVLASQSVGQALGITLRPPPEIAAGGKLRDPIAAIARASKVRVRRVMLKEKWWTKDSGPLLVFRDRDSYPLALLPRSATGYDLYDPVSRTTTRVNSTTALELNGFAFAFYRPFPPIKLNANDLLSFGAANGHRDIWIILVMGIASGVLAMITPIATGIVFDSIIPGAQKPALFSLTMFLVVSAISTALFNIARSIATLRLEGKMDASIQAAVWDRLLSLPVPFFRNFSSGDLATRSMGINQIRRTLTGSTLSSILSGFFSLFSFALLYYYSWRLANLAAGLILLAFAVSIALGYWQISYQRDMSKLRGRISGMLLQFIIGISKLRVSGTENRAFVTWARQFARQRELSTKARDTSNHLTVFNAAYPVLCTAGIFMYTSYLMTQPGIKALTTGDFLAFNAAFGQFLTAMLQLSSSIVSVLSIVPLYERAKPILESLPEVSFDKSNPGELAGSIELNHVLFRYRPDTPLILRDVSISILPGQFVAFVGPSGSGKSTLLRLLLGFETPESGAVYYDGQDLSGLDVQAVRQQMGVVLQTARLLSGDIFLNIVGSAPLTVDDAWEAARLSGFDQDIQGMPMGMHTVIAEGGGGLSGGQRQRLLIARAIVGKPRIVLFDEATSALDNQTQATVSRSLETLQATRIVIAHRLSTIVNADKIFVLDKGIIVQSGTYDELMAQEGHFQELAKRQLI